MRGMPPKYFVPALIIACPRARSGRGGFYDVDLDAGVIDE